MSDFNSGNSDKCVLFDINLYETRGVSRIFERGGPISLGSLKKRSSDFKRGASNGLKGGSSTFVSLGRQILTYLDAKE